MFFPGPFVAVPSGYYESVPQLRDCSSVVMDFILRYTAGFQRKSHRLSTSFLANACQLAGRTVRSALAKLKKLGLIEVTYELYEHRRTKVIHLGPKVFEGTGGSASMPTAAASVELAPAPYRVAEPAVVVPEAPEPVVEERAAEPEAVVCESPTPVIPVVKAVVEPAPASVEPVPVAVPVVVEPEVIPLPVQSVPVAQPSPLTQSLLSGLVQLGMKSMVASKLLSQSDPVVVQKTLQNLDQFKNVRNPAAFVFEAIKRGGYEPAPRPEQLLKQKHEKIAEQRRQERTSEELKREQEQRVFDAAFEVYQRLAPAQQESILAQARSEAGRFRTGDTIDCPILRSHVLAILVRERKAMASC